MTDRSWTTTGLPDGVFDELALRLPASSLWSMLMEVVAARAGRRRPADLIHQWRTDRFVQPSIVDPRLLLEVDRHLLAAAEAFEAIELSPVAPLGVCSQMGRASQHKVLSALRGTEVVADPTNVLALECAKRLRGDSAALVHLAASHRCVRAQALPRAPGFTASFRMFCLASSGVERQDHAVVVDALTLHLTTILRGLDALERHGFAFGARRVTVLATERRAALADRIASRIEQPTVLRGPLDHPYYSSGLRFQVDATSSAGAPVPLADGGAFDWVASLSSNRRAVYVASGFGSQLAAALFRRTDGV